MSSTVAAPAAARRHPGGPASDPRLAAVEWRIPDQNAARRRSAVLAVLCALLAAWYLSWLLQGERVGEEPLFGILIAAEAFNLLQAVGFWWTCSRQRIRPARLSPDPGAAVDVLIPAYDEPVDVVEPTIAAAMRIRGAATRVWLLDDGDRAEMEELSRRHGAGYLTREQRSGAKAGNLNNALAHTDAPYVLVLDCDHVPRPDFLELTLGHLRQPGVAFVQTPQYYANGASGPVAAAAAAQQSLFFGPISRGKDGLDAMFCCGTNVVFRRTALRDAGGFPEDSVTEDFELSIRLHERGWRSAYVPEVLASGLGPEDMASYVSQQQRWARGCLSAIPTVLRARLPWRQRIQYLLSATYFLSGWTLVIYMSLPLLRILFGIQPLAAATADQFLLHFAPYYCTALATVAVAGFGTYTFGAFALAAGSFWIHVQSALSALLRRPARFVVTPKHGAAGRQPRAVWPALVAITSLVGVSIYGLLRDRSAATMNNVAFASLHASVLLTAVIPALRVGSSAPLLPDPPAPEPLRPRRWPRPLAAMAVAGAIIIPGSVALVGSRGLDGGPSASGRAHAAGEQFLGSYVRANGRVVRRDQGGDTVSEGQAYAMLASVALDDRARFAKIWGWTRAYLQRTDGLLAYHWVKGRVVSEEPATDADLDAARALVLAGKRFGEKGYTDAGARIGRAVLDNETATVDGLPVLVAGPWATATATVNPSYFSPRAFADLARAAPDPRWSSLEATSRAIVAALTRDGRLPPDWAQVSSIAAGPNGSVLAQALPLPSAVGSPTSATAGAGSPSSGLDAVRTAIRYAESCMPADRRLAARLWPRYSPAPGRIAYALDGPPRSSLIHPAALVGAAAAAQADHDRSAAARLLDRAQTVQGAHPTYYGAAWLTLGRVMLDSTALGGCRSPR